MIGPSYLPSVLFLLGLVSVFAGERFVGAGTGRSVLTGFGLLLALGATAWRAISSSARTASADRRRVEQSLLRLYVTALIALALYFAGSDLWLKVAHARLSISSPTLAVVLSVLWPALMALAVIPIVLVEMAYSSMTRSPRIETERVSDALRSGMGMALALVFAFGAAYVADARDAKWDFSYFRTAKPSQATRKLVEGLDQELEVTLFFPPANEVGEQVRDYFKELAPASSKLKVSVLDQAVDPFKAKQLGVLDNGALAVHRGGAREVLKLGLQLESARNQLRDLDKEVQTRILKTAKARRSVYFTSGHGELSVREVAADPRPTDRTLQEAMRAQNYDVKELGTSEGLGTAVPGDAAMVWILGPNRPFLAEEVASLKKYLEGGGRIFLALDPDSGVDLSGLLKPVGLKYLPVSLANDQAFLARTRQPSDRGAIATAGYTSHPAITTLGQMGRSAPMVLIGAGALEADAAPPPGWSTELVVRAHSATWNDANNNFQADPGEVRKEYGLIAAVRGAPPAPHGQAAGGPIPSGRMVVLSDSDALGDFAIQNRGNAFFAVDSMRWLLGDEALSGLPSSEVDVPVQHTRDQDVAWFYGSVFGAPLAVLALGFVVTRRRGRKAGRLEQAGPGAGQPQEVAS